MYCDKPILKDKTITTTLDLILIDKPNNNIPSRHILSTHNKVSLVTPIKDMNYNKIHFL